MRNKAPLYYPVFLDIRDRDCVVVGGGKVAERKVAGLLGAGARVRVISPTLTGRLRKEKSRGRLTHISRPFRRADLRGALLAIAATDDEGENRRTASAGGRTLVNVVDRPELCGFIVPSVIRRGPLQIAVSTSGASPALAKAIRKELETLYGPEFGKFLRRLAKKRAVAISSIKDKSQRSVFLKSLVPKDMLKGLRAKGRRRF